MMIFVSMGVIAFKSSLFTVRVFVFLYKFEVFLPAE